MKILLIFIVLISLSCSSKDKDIEELSRSIIDLEVKYKEAVISAYCLGWNYGCVRGFESQHIDSLMAKRKHDSLFFTQHVGL